MAIDNIATLDIVVVLLLIRQVSGETTARNLSGPKSQRAGRYGSSIGVVAMPRVRDSSASEPAVRAQHAFHLSELADGFCLSGTSPSLPGH
jgi:hypothetical protein